MSVSGSGGPGQAGAEVGPAKAELRQVAVEAGLGAVDVGAAAVAVWKAHRSAGDKGPSSDGQGAHGYPCDVTRARSTVSNGRP